MTKNTIPIEMIIRDNPKKGDNPDVRLTQYEIEQNSETRFLGKR